MAKKHCVKCDGTAHGRATEGHAAKHRKSQMHDMSDWAGQAVPRPI